MRPSILWITDDQHHADCFGHRQRSQVQTPNIDRLVRNGVSFDRSYAVAPACVPSRISMLTGMYVHSHGVYNEIVDMPDLPTLPRCLQDRGGYRTAIIGKKHYGNWAREPFQSDTGPAIKGYTDEYLGRYGLSERFIEEYLSRVPDFMTYTSRIPHEHSETEWVTNETIARIDELGDEPFFIWCNFSAPHPPYCNAFDSPHLVDPDSLDLSQVAHCDPEDLHALSLRPGARRLGVENIWRREVTGEAIYREALAHYYGMCAAVDAGIGRMLAHLEARGVLRDTILVFNSDHGDFAGEYGMLGKNTVGHFECIQRIPTVWYWQGRFGCERIDSFVENIDIFPTLCDLLDVETPYTVQGESYADILRYSASGPGPALTTKDRVFFDHSSVKTVRTRRHWMSYFGGTQNWGELYDFQEDPHGRTNCFDDPAYAYVRSNLMRALLDWTIATEQPIGPDPECGALPASRWYREHPIAKTQIETNTYRLRNDA